MSHVHEPKLPSESTKKLKAKERSDPSFASLVYDLRDTMKTHEATPNRMRAALRLLLHDEAWRTYRRVLREDVIEENVEEEDGFDPLEI